MLLVLVALSFQSTTTSAQKKQTVNHTAKHSTKHTAVHSTTHSAKHTAVHSTTHSAKHTAKHSAKPAAQHTVKHSTKHTVKHTAHSTRSVKAYDSTSEAGKYVTFPQAGVSIRQPQGFHRSDSFDGFSRSQQQASVIVLGVPGSLAKISGEFSDEHLSRKGWPLLDRQDITVSNMPGVLIHFEQKVGDAVSLKWVLLFGDEQRTTIVMGTAPKIYADQLSASLKECLLSTRISAQGLPETARSIPFTLEASPKLRPASSIGQTLRYSKDGAIQKASPEEPVFTAAFSDIKEPISNKRKFAERRLMDNFGMNRISIISTRSLALDGVEGFESTASAVDAKSGTPVIVYQVMLFEKSRYILMQGIAGAALRDEYLPEFKSIAYSLKRKQSL